MIYLGFAIKKGELWYSVLEGNHKSDAQIKIVEKKNFQATQDIEDLMMYFYNLFSEVISQYSPNSVACKLSLDADIKQIPYLHCSIGVLAYLCKQNNLTLTLRSNSWITASKKKKLIECETRFQSENLKNEKLFSTLVAFHEFGV